MKILSSKKPILLFIFGIYCCHFLSGQDTIYLKNPSFEDVPRKGVPGSPRISMWQDCAVRQFTGESPPDIHPVKGNAWGVSMQPQDGNSYLGLVARASSSWESVGQQLSIPLRRGVCYTFNAMLALSETYKGPTRTSYRNGVCELESFAHPVVFVVWGGQFECDKMEILAESSDVDNFEWKRYSFILLPHHEYTYITLEAYYSKSSLKRYNGHIMVDNLSPIIKIDCK